MHFEYYVFYLWHAHLILKTLSDRVFSFAKVQFSSLQGLIPLRALRNYCCFEG